MNTAISVSVQADIANHAKTGIVFKNDKLVLVVDETDCPLSIEEVVMKNGAVSGIRIQKSNSEMITLTLEEMEEKSQVAVRNFIKNKGQKVIITEKKNEKNIEKKFTEVSESYIQFLCSVHPEKSECH
jgi:hypothetical protein